MVKSTISCELHDYIEIACMHGYRVKLTLRDGQTVEGKALDTLTTADKREYLVIDSGQKEQVELNRIAKMKAVTQHAVFTDVSF